MKRNLVVLVALCMMSFNSTAQKKVYNFATYTYSTNNRLQNLEPVVAYLSEQTGLVFKAVSYPTVQALLNGIKDGSVDFAMMNTSGYLLFQKKYGGMVSPLVNLDMGFYASTSYAGCLITLKKSGFKSVDDILKNSQIVSLALVAPSSTSGNLVPRMLLNEKGIANAESNFIVSYSGTHKNVVEDVLNGKVAVGGCGCAEIDSARKNLNFDDKALVIHSFGNIPLGPIVHNNKIAGKLNRNVGKLLQNLHQVQPEVFQNFCAGWTEFKKAVKFKPVSDSDYNVFRNMLGNNPSLWKLME